MYYNHIVTDYCHLGGCIAMAFFKCKMCGGDLNVNSTDSVIECEFCGSRQSIPASKDENLQALFNRANILRMKAEFDKAEEIYEKILQVDEKEAEAHWGIILCKYGIEYVEDPKTYKRIPTCHRTSFDAITTDEDYKDALKYADTTRRIIYESEAKVIDDIQKGILDISLKEDPYDVFICYKETDENGRRTIDSSIANDIYYQLTQEGLKVLYSAITLEDKLGTEYEPYIFSALNSSKVMLVIGTRPEYFNSVWVKNEWSRYLKIMKTDRSRLLIPCYKDMDAYELPEDFAHLQAQDMSKIGFINDVVRGIKKVIVKEPDSSTTIQNEIVYTSSNATVESLMKRTLLFLEDKDWQKADNYCEQILDMDPEYAMAYVGKMMAEFEICHIEELADLDDEFDDNDNFKKAIRFGEVSLQEKLNGLLQTIRERKNGDLYQAAVLVKRKARTEDELNEAIRALDEFKGYRDADALIEECKERLAQIDLDKKEKKYEATLTLMKNASSKEALNNVLGNLESLRGYKDVNEQIAACKNRINIIRIEEALSENELESIAEEINITDNPQLIDHIEKARHELKNSKKEALSLWQSYLQVIDRSEALEKEKKACETNISNYSKQFLEMGKDEQLLNDELLKIASELTELQSNINKLENQISQDTTHLERLGFFDLSEKNELKKQITRTKAELDGHRSEEGIVRKKLEEQSKKIEILKSKPEYIAEKEKIKDRKKNEEEKLYRINDERIAVNKDHAKWAKQLGTPKILAALLVAGEDDVFDAIVKDDEFWPVISNDAKLAQLVIGSKVLFSLPFWKQEKIKSLVR